jgi:hypothetical protein
VAGWCLPFPARQVVALRLKSEGSEYASASIEERALTSPNCEKQARREASVPAPVRTAPKHVATVEDRQLSQAPAKEQSRMRSTRTYKEGPRPALGARVSGAWRWGSSNSTCS